MAKRNFRNAASNPLDNSDDSQDNSWLATDSQIFGALANVDSQTVRIHKISIFDIQPDPTQPRRVVPYEIRQRWDGSAHQVSEMLIAWVSAIQEEREDSEFDLGAYLEGGFSDRSGQVENDNPLPLPEMGPLEAAFMPVVELAASIRRDGLTNAITVAPSGSGYRLETGERRWLAYHLLFTWCQDTHPEEQENWGTIPAREVDEIDVWRQASENNARANLNAVSKSRQWAVLMMDLHGMDKFKPLDAFSNEQGFYAQAASLRPPYGKGEQLLNAMGVSSRSVISRLRGMLTLPYEIWQGGDDYNLSEDALNDLAHIAKTNPNLAIQRFREIVHKAQPETKKKIKNESKVGPGAPGTKRHFSHMVSAITKAGQGKHKANATALQTLRELRIWLDEQEDRISKFVD